MIGKFVSDVLCEVSGKSCGDEFTVIGGTREVGKTLQRN